MHGALEVFGGEGGHRRFLLLEDVRRGRLGGVDDGVRRYSKTRNDASVGSSASA